MQNIPKMFQSATLKLTIWYLAGIMLVCLVFSVLVYNFASGELYARFEVIEARLAQSTTVLAQSDFNFETVRDRQIAEAEHNIVGMLLYANLAVLAIASVASYILAKRTLRPIEAAHEAQTKFTSDASHELKTPLAVMKTELEVILSDSGATKQDYREILESNLEEVDRLSELSSTLLKLARLEYSELEWRKFNITETVDTAIRSLGERADRIDVEAVKKLPDIEANPTSITELAVVLLDNALKYSPSDTRVTVSLKRRVRSVELSVTNIGVGIAPDKLPHIFTRFYRASSSRTLEENASYGLGLPLAKKIVELHHGELTASSQPGVFTTFTVRIPLSQTRAL
ncbi:hypothetical protein GII36_02700 [Candidatus Mycosynbacter amalyticus]|uniref:histidine kinase n=1 Tax=Candidatus Mycosynbacter amalyticus TaxID=2665156 RepID=A0A857MJM6_9BACT|nr:HAMP domain-containing sensor histidine kinase [Candidatus Mycosynbacter amalyticus]QHN42753.1 hypothetical protein GII36_02700 [Candidatus Mycosynbacter amalyticus]